MHVNSTRNSTLRDSVAMRKLKWTSKASQLVPKDAHEHEHQQAELFPKVSNLGDFKNIEKILVYDRSVHPIARET